MPKRLAVRYRLFEGEDAAWKLAAINESHEFSGELVLSFQDDPDIFISWVSDPVQYCIGTSGSSHFVPEAALTDVDVTTTIMWSDLVGQNVLMELVGRDSQMIAISNNKNRLLLCSFEHGDWLADGVTVCREAPAPYGA